MRLYSDLADHQVSIGNLLRCFIVGTGRCGSTLSHAFFAGMPMCLAFRVSDRARRKKSVRTVRDGWSDAVAVSQHCERDLSAIVRARPNLPEILLNERQREQSVESAIAPLLLIALPHISEDPEGLLLELRSVVVGLSRASIAVQLTRIFEWLRARFGKKTWVERSGASLEYVEHLTNNWKDAGFIHIVRDGRDCAYSMSRHPVFQVKMARLLRRDPQFGC